MTNSGPNDNLRREVTDPKVYFNRRAFMKAGVGLASIAATGWIYRQFNHPPTQMAELPLLPEDVPSTQASAGPDAEPASMPSTEASNPNWNTDEPQTSYEDITHWNNFYEFTESKTDVADRAAGMITSGWKLSVEGLVSKPTVFDMDDLMKIAPIEERIYRMRCVEAWSMVVPWNGFPLGRLLDRVQPLSSAKYVAFQSLYDPQRMPNMGGNSIPFPYVEGLRMDEAMHPLAILAVGLYGRVLPPQDGAPIRLVTPWKYGFKGAKSLIQIKLVDSQPTTWNEAAPNEYGFYANVNPKVDHPRWSQAREQRIGVGYRPTLMFNGYADQVAGLYTGMDLKKYF